MCSGGKQGRNYRQCHFFFLPLFSFLHMDNRDEGLDGNNHDRTEGTDPGVSIGV
jgi:hypothetical protein